MPKRSNKKPPAPQDTQQRARSIPDGVAPNAEAAKKAKAPRPKTKLDAADVDRAEGEGMAQPQGLPS